MRDEIIATATNQLREGGYAQLNFRDLASQHETTRANLHHHFVNKAGLAHAAISAYSVNVLHDAKRLAERHDDDFAGYLLAIEKRVLASASSVKRALPCPCSQLKREEDVPGDVRDLTDEFFAKKFAIMQAVAQKAQASGKLTTDQSPGDIAEKASALIQGLSSALELSSDPLRTKKALEGMVSNFLHGLQAGQS